MYIIYLWISIHELQKLVRQGISDTIIHMYHSRAGLNLAALFSAIPRVWIASKTERRCIDDVRPEFFGQWVSVAP